MTRQTQTKTNERKEIEIKPGVSLEEIVMGDILIIKKEPQLMLGEPTPIRDEKELVISLGPIGDKQIITISRVKVGKKETIQEYHRFLSWYDKDKGKFSRTYISGKIYEKGTSEYEEKSKMLKEAGCQNE